VALQIVLAAPSTQRVKTAAGLWNTKDASRPCLEFSVSLTVKQAAQHASVSESLIYAWCSDGTLPHTRVGRQGKRGHIRIAVEDLDSVLAAFKVSTRPAQATPLPLKHITLD
jgi:excisionase family DNA binding protein